MSDSRRAGQIGSPLDRIDAPLKVTGGATYAYEYAGQGKVAYGFIVGASIASGRIRGIATAEAARLPGVLVVMTHQNAPQQGAYVTADKVPQDKRPYGVARHFL